MNTPAEVLQSLIFEFERTIREADRINAGKHGWQVQFHGDFVAALKSPSMLTAMRWWIREGRRVLDTERGTDE